MKEKILQLRKEGKSYREIVKLLNCSKGTVAYHLGKGQKEKTKARSYIRREKKNQQQKKSRIKRKEFIWKYKQLCGCSNCGYNKHPVALDFDHIDPRTKEANIGELVSSLASMELLKKEIRKCQVLCANCHRIKTHKNKENIKIL